MYPTKTKLFVCILSVFFLVCHNLFDTYLNLVLSLFLSSEIAHTFLRTNMHTEVVLISLLFLLSLRFITLNVTYFGFPGYFFLFGNPFTYNFLLLLIIYFCFFFLPLFLLYLFLLSYFSLLIFFLSYKYKSITIVSMSK